MFLDFTPRFWCLLLSPLHTTNIDIVFNRCWSYMAGRGRLPSLWGTRCTRYAFSQAYVRYTQWCTCMPEDCIEAHAHVGRVPMMHHQVQHGSFVTWACYVQRTGLRVLAVECPTSSGDTRPSTRTLDSADLARTSPVLVVLLSGTHARQNIQHFFKFQQTRYMPNVEICLVCHCPLQIPSFAVLQTKPWRRLP